MRRLSPRPKLPKAAQTKLAEKTTEIAQASDQHGTAERVYTNSRGAQWFRPVVRALQRWAGPGERCMYCCGSESSEVEHFRPITLAPVQAMTWENFLWACGLCNRSKGDQFPLDAQQQTLLLHPELDNVWDYFFLDEFGELICKWRLDLGAYDPRADTTLTVLGLDRQALQESRRMRYKRLKRAVKETLTQHQHKPFTLAQLKRQLNEWLREPFQMDVADYFLNGPGREEQPFCQFLQLLESS